MTIEKELRPFLFEESEAFLKRMEEDFLEIGILLPAKGKEDSPQGEKPPAGEYAEDWLRPFVLPAAQLAFYLAVNRREDLAACGEQFKKGLSELREQLVAYTENNEQQLSPELRRKMDAFRAKLSKAIKLFVAKRQKLEKEDYDDVKEMREAAAKFYGEFLNKFVFSPIIEPLYEGLREHAHPAYLWLLREVNAFLQGLGVLTIPAASGQQCDMERYVPTDDSKQNVTADESLKECVREVIHYAYAFHDDGLWPIWDGAASVWNYRKG